jgi:hypothetical protein
MKVRLLLNNPGIKLSTTFDTFYLAPSKGECEQIFGSNFHLRIQWSRCNLNTEVSFCLAKQIEKCE